MRGTLTAALLIAGCGAAFAQGGGTMTAEMMSRDGESLGTVTFEGTESGFVHLTADLTGLPAGVHGFHVHETGACDAAGGFESAGGHYAGDMEHGVEAAGGPHPGDFPNVHVGDDGVLQVEYFTDRISVSSEGDNPLADADGSALVIHSGADDYSSQPSGDAGDRIACGVIE